MTEAQHSLVVADISGYTRFVVENRQHWRHAQVLISELLQEVVSRAEPSLRLEKLEGDAAFFVERDPQQNAEAIQGPIANMFEGFGEILRRAVDQNPCKCEACTGMDRLRLKVVAHRGAIAHQAIAGRDEVSGLAVIVTHRLLKNSVRRSHYILLTEEALQGWTGPEADLERGKLADKDLGSIPYWVHFPPDPLGLAPASRAPWARRFLRGLWLMTGDILFALGLRKSGTFRNIAAEASAEPAGAGTPS